MGSTGRFPFKDYGQENLTISVGTNGSTFDMHNATELVAILNVSAVATSLDGTIQQSLDGGATWGVVATFATVSAAPNRQIFHYAPDNASLGLLRAVYVPVGSVTVSVDFLALGESDTTLGDQI